MNTNHLKLGIWALLASSSLGLMAAQEPIVRYKILANSPEQHILHFGASDAWSMQFLGLWSEKQQQKIADWLFSMENDTQGKPKGIGLFI